MKYIALLRGINVGGNKKVPMVELKKAFESLGFHEVKTLLNSGNAVFSTSESDVSKLKKIIEEELEKSFGWHIDTFIYPQESLQQMVKKDPFAQIVVTTQTRLYVSFIPENTISNLEIPYESPEKNFKILQVSEIAIFSVLILSEKYNTTDAMKIIGKEFGKNVTTRNWNTVIKLAIL